jgi:hypothetical protein
MKRTTLLCLILLSGLFTFAQDVAKQDSLPGKHGRKHPPFAFIGLSAGINNPSGAFGFDFEVPVKKYLMLGGGLGWGTWGNKSHADVKYFLKRQHTGWALTGGFAFCSGQYNFRARLHTQGNTRELVTLNLQPVAVSYFGASYYKRIGRTPNRVFVTAGWCVPLTRPEYTVDYNGPALADRSDRWMKFREPGGPMLGVGMLFGLRH